MVDAVPYDGGRVIGGPASYAYVMPWGGFFATRALYEGADLAAWKEWGAGIDSVQRKQIGGARHTRGSWDPDGVWGSDGGRVYSTAIVCLTLQRYYRDRILATRR